MSIEELTQRKAALTKELHEVNDRLTALRLAQIYEVDGIRIGTVIRRTDDQREYRVTRIHIGLFSQTGAGSYYSLYGNMRKGDGNWGKRDYFIHRDWEVVSNDK